MKKIIVLTFALLISLSAFSQNYERAVGLRLGTSIGANYKQFLTAGSAFEAMASIDIIGKDDRKISFGGYGEYHYALDLEVDGLSLYFGPGATIGFYVAGPYRDKAVMTMDLIGGVEYKLHSYPLILAFDWNPQFQMVTDAGIKPANFGLSVRYTF